MIFGGTVIDKQFTLTPDESYPYNIQRHGWKTRTNNSVFDPHEATLRDIQYSKNHMFNLENDVNDVRVVCKKCIPSGTVIKTLCAQTSPINPEDIKVCIA